MKCCADEHMVGKHLPMTLWNIFIAILDSIDVAYEVYPSQCETH